MGVSGVFADDIANRFDYHPANDTKKLLHEGVRGTCRSAAEYFEGLLPEGREKSLAITKLEEAMFWANAAIARNHD